MMSRFMSFMIPVVAGPAAWLTSILAVTLASGAAGIAAEATGVRGEQENPNGTFGPGVAYRLLEDTTFGWRTGTLAGDIDLNGRSFVIETGGGNHTVCLGAVSGAGTFEWRGGGVPQVAPSILSGTRPNTFQGRFILTRGVLDLDKPSGVTAIPGDLVIGTKGDAIVRLAQADQIHDASRVTLGGSGISGLELQGHDERFARLLLETHAAIDFGATPATLAIGDCRAEKWDLTKTLTVRGFKPGRDRLVFGTGEGGLAPAQLARVGFASPAGYPSGLYTATIRADGQLAPGTRVEAVRPPFDVSARAVADREAIHAVDGVARLTGPGSPLRDGMTIAFFGDSITWQNGFIGKLEESIRNGAGTRDRKVRLVNRGINGGGVLQVRDGSTNSAFPGSSAQQPFAAALAADRADLAVVFIGINDVWWRQTAPATFEQALRDLVAAARARSTRLILATPAVRGERPDGGNGDDARIDQFAALMRAVANDTGTPLIDVRRAFIAYLQNHNAQLRVDGSLFFKPSGVLTYDGVHPSPRGVSLLTELMADGVARALEPGRSGTPGE